MRRTATRRGAAAEKATAGTQAAPKVRRPLRKPRRPNASAASRKAPRVPLLAPALVLAAAVALGFSLKAAACAPTEDIAFHQVEPQGIAMGVQDRARLYASPLNWENLSSEGDFLSYRKDGQVLSRLGIDVSEHNATVDWDKVRRAGVEFAYVRLGYRGSQTGTIAEDPLFEQNIRGAREAGLKVGVYFFSQAVNEAEAREEADFVASKLGGAGLDYPIAFDMEPDSQGRDRVAGISVEQMTATAAAFCRQCTNNGYNAVVYGNQHDLMQYNLGALAEYGFWYAEYGGYPTMSLNMAMWQYTHEGSVDGVEGNCDINLDLTPALGA